MLLLIGAWGLLLAVGLVLGTALFPLHRLERAGDRLIAGAWLGLTVLAAGLLALSLALPLASAPAAAIVAALTLGLLPRARGAAADLRTAARPANLLGALLLVCAVAAIGAQRQASYGDVGLYHYPILQWLGSYGTVPGLALLYQQLSMAATWYAPAALFDGGAFAARVDAIPGGLVLLLGSLHLVLALSRILRRRADRADGFAAAALVLVLPFLAGKVAISPSPDAAVAILTVMTGWTMLVVPARRRVDGDAGAAGDPDGNRAEEVLLRLVPVVLAAGAAAMKLSGMPVLAIALLYFVAGSPGRLRAAVTGGGAALLILSPMLAYGLVTSGCPLYPVSHLCLDLPWSLEPAMSGEHVERVQNFTRGIHDPAAISGWPWIARFPAANPLITAGILFSVLYGVPKLVRGRRRPERPDDGWIAAMGLAGIAFVLLSAPLPRFMIGSVALVPALFASSFLEGRRRTRGAASRAGRAVDARGHGRDHEQAPHGWSRRLAFPLPSALLALGILTAYPILNLGSIPRYGFSKAVDLSRLEWLRPAPLPSDVPVVERDVNDLRYRSPAKRRRCWAVEPPCTPEISSPRIRLRDPERGIAGGFVRTTPTASDGDRPAGRPDHGGGARAEARAP